MENLNVAIVGMIPTQINEIQSAYGDRLDLKFVDTGTSMSHLRSVASSSDHVVLLTKFISHEVQSAVRKHDGLHFCNGGVSSVKNKLDAILKQNTDPA